MSSFGILSLAACALFVACSLVVTPAQGGERHALLIGISDYPGDKLDLEGPIHDVSLLREIMVDRRIVAPSRIDTLVDQEASKHDIERALREHARKRVRGETLFVYLSGHGTSPTAEDYLPLPHATGAFVPGDYVGDAVNSVDDYVDALIIGRRDLRPHLETLDRNGVRVLVAIDACYSEFTSRSPGMIQQQGEPRYMATPEGLDRRSGATAGCSDCTARSTDNVPDYPYRHVFTLAAAGTDETAIDLGRTLVDRVPTMDMRPHGAFSDSFARVLAGKIHSDTNNDGVTSNAELFRATRRFMRRRGYPHTPHAYPTVDHDRIGIAFEAFLSADHIAPAPSGGDDDSPQVDNGDSEEAVTTQDDGASGTQPETGEQAVSADVCPSTAKALRVQLASGLSERIVDRIAAIDGVRLVDSPGDAYVATGADGSVRVLTANGDRVARFDANDAKALAGALRQQRLVKHLGRRCDSDQDFNVTLDLAGIRQAGHLYAGERFGLVISAERRAHLAVYSINARGRLHPLYPYTKAEASPVAARQVIRLPDESTVLRVKPPYGTDYVLAVAYRGKRPPFADLVGRSGPLSEAETLRLAASVTHTDGERAAALLKVTTRPPR